MLGKYKIHHELPCLDSFVDLLSLLHPLLIHTDPKHFNFECNVVLGKKNKKILLKWLTNYA